jgi:hypothetical protein
LKAMGFLESLLDRVQVVWRSQALDGRDLVAVGLYGEHQAGADGLPIKEDGAGPAHPMLTPDVGAGEAKVVAQKVAEQ